VKVNRQDPPVFLTEERQKEMAKWFSEDRRRFKDTVVSIMEALDWKSQQIGKRFQARDGYVYKCAEWDKEGFWMEREDDPTIRINVAERVIGKVYQELPEEGFPKLERPQ